MWTCPSCGEQHEDQFKECWKCFGKELQHAVTANSPPPLAPPRMLRSYGAILARMIVGALIGTLLGVAVFHRWGVSLADAFVAGAIAGGVIGLLVGIFFWVLFPYEPGFDAGPVPEDGDSPRQSPD